jgi:hypothetical protein
MLNLSAPPVRGVNVNFFKKSKGTPPPFWEPVFVRREAAGGLRGTVLRLHTSRVQDKPGRAAVTELREGGNPLQFRRNPGGGNLCGEQDGSKYFFIRRFLER